jgi:hypothetical protein
LTPLEQTTLPWCVVGTDRALASLPGTLTRLDEAMAAGTVLGIIEDLPGVQEHLIIVHLDADDRYDEILRITVRIDPSLSIGIDPTQKTRDVIATLIESPPGTGYVPVDEDEAALAIMQLAERNSFQIVGQLLFGEFRSKTPLGTGGLHVEDFMSDLHAVDLDRCVPGPVDVHLTEALPKGMVDAPRRAEMTISAFSEEISIAPPDALERMRLETRVHEARAARRSHGDSQKDGEPS